MNALRHRVFHGRVVSRLTCDNEAHLLALRDALSRPAILSRRFRYISGLVNCRGEGGSRDKWQSVLVRLILLQ